MSDFQPYYRKVVLAESRTTLLKSLFNVNVGFIYVVENKKPGKGFDSRSLAEARQYFIDSTPITDRITWYELPSFPS
jgi:hypothetical protein